MKFTKIPLTFDEQADLLLSRGLIASHDEIVERLTSVNYYRLSGYLYNFRRDDGSYKPGTTLKTVWTHYTFDRQLRLIVIDALERIEVAIRTQLAYYFAHEHGPFAYTNHNNLPHIDSARFSQWQAELQSELLRSKERFVQHFQFKYGDEHEVLPIWMLVEVMSFGRTLTFYNGVGTDIRQSIAKEFGIPEAVLQSWLRALNTVRNICAHHGRLWNRELGVKPLMPREQKYPQWHHPVDIPNNRVFGILTILRFMLKTCAPTSAWNHRIQQLFNEYSDLPLNWMGLPDNWHESPLWS